MYIKKGLSVVSTKFNVVFYSYNLVYKFWPKQRHSSFPPHEATAPRDGLPVVTHSDKLNRIHCQPLGPINFEYMKGALTANFCCGLSLQCFSGKRP